MLTHKLTRSHVTRLGRIALLTSMIYVVTDKGYASTCPANAHDWQSIATKFTEIKISHKATVKTHQLTAYASANKKEITANLVFLHGFADTMKNHKQLFGELLGSNLRVLGFDYPEHGENKNTSINTWSMEGVANILASLLSASELNVNLDKPLILVGWSTGGTMALRIGQEWKAKIEERMSGKKIKLAGIVALAPAVGLPLNFDTAKDAFTEVKNEVLTSCSTGMQAPSPKYPLQAGLFSNSLLKQSNSLAKIEANSSIPTLVFVAKSNDEFVNTQASLDWIEATNDSNSNLLGIYCDTANHGMEFEGDGLGKMIQKNIAQFAKQAAIAKLGAKVSFKPTLDNRCRSLAKSK